MNKAVPKTMTLSKNQAYGKLHVCNNSIYFPVCSGNRLRCSLLLLHIGRIFAFAGEDDQCLCFLHQLHD